MEPVSIPPRQRNGRLSQPRRPTAATPPRRGAGGSLPRQSRGARGTRPSDIVAESKVLSRPGSDRDAPQAAIRPRSRERKGRGRIQSERRFRSYWGRAEQDLGGTQSAGRCRRVAQGACEAEFDQVFVAFNLVALRFMKDILLYANH